MHGLSKGLLWVGSKGCDYQGLSGTFGMHQVLAVMAWRCERKKCAFRSFVVYVFMYIVYAEAGDMLSSTYQLSICNRVSILSTFIWNKMKHVAYANSIHSIHGCWNDGRCTTYSKYN